jgi:membrane protein DedA with SNARE-associated domain
MIDFLTAGFNELLQFADNIEPGYIYFFLFSIAFLENIFPPIPGDTFTIVGGYLAACGRLDLLSTFAAITLGTISSVMIIYYFGYHGGRDYLVRKNLRIFSAKDLEQVQRWFTRYGAGTLLCSRFIVGARVAVAFGAGLSKFPPIRMVLYSYISGALFHGLLIALSLLMYAYIEELAEWFNLYNKIILVIVAALVIMWIIVVAHRFRNERKKI